MITGWVLAAMSKACYSIINGVVNILNLQLEQR